MDLKALLAKIDGVTDASTLFTAISSACTLTPSSSPLFPLLTLPSLLHRQSSSGIESDSDLSGQLHLREKALAMLIGGASGSLITSWGILPSALETLVSQSLISTCTALCITLILWLHAKFEQMLDAREDWMSSPLFGLIWAVSWLIWTVISPLGRHVGHLRREYTPC